MSLMLLIAAAAAAARPEPLRTFGDWTVGCDNAGYCKAVSLQPDGPEGFETSIMTLERSSAPDARPRIEIDVRSDEKATAILIDETAEKLELSNDGTLKACDPLQFIRRIQRARNIDLANSKGEIITRISVNGASAALRWMDERQRRSGTSSAIVAVGSRRAENGELALPAIKQARSSAIPATKLSTKREQAVRSAYDCAGFGREDEPVSYQRLDQATTLALVPCMMGAYQKSSVAVLVGNDGNYRASMLEFGEEEQPDNLIEPEFDPRTQELWSTHKGRGMGDCGGTDAWVWDGKAFRLIYRDRMDECRGSGHRITLWRTANHPQVWKLPF